MRRGSASASAEQFGRMVGRQGEACEEHREEAEDDLHELVRAKPCIGEHVIGVGVFIVETHVRTYAIQMGRRGKRRLTEH